MPVTSGKPWWCLRQPFLSYCLYPTDQPVLSALPEHIPTWHHVHMAPCPGRPLQPQPSLPCVKFGSGPQAARLLLPRHPQLSFLKRESEIVRLLLRSLSWLFTTCHPVFWRLSLSPVIFHWTIHGERCSWPTSRQRCATYSFVALLITAVKQFHAQLV